MRYLYTWILYSYTLTIVTYVILRVLFPTCEGHMFSIGNLSYLGKYSLETKKSNMRNTLLNI